MERECQAGDGEGQDKDRQDALSAASEAPCEAWPVTLCPSDQRRHDSPFCAATAATSACGNSLLAHTQILYSFYKKHHWLMRWIKTPLNRTVEVIVAGWKPGEGRRAG